MLALTGVVVILAFPGVVFGGRTFNTSWVTVGVNGFTPAAPDVKLPRDDIHLDAGASAWQFEPWAEVTARAYRSGEPPLWNPYQGMGTPLAANFQSAAFDPLLAPVNLHPAPLMWDLAYLLAFLMGAAGTYLFLRALGIGRFAALLGVVVFIFSGFFFLLSNNQFFRAYMYLPVLLLLARLTVRSKGTLPMVGLGLTVAGSVLIGMPEASVLVLGTLMAYCGFVVLTDIRGARTGAATRLALAATLGVLLAAPLLFPALEYIPASHNTHEGAHQVGLFTAPPGHLLNWLMPYVLGRPVGAAPGLSSGVRDWVGIASCIAVLGAMASPRPMRRHGGWFFFLFGLLFVLKAYGFPLVKWTGRLPILDKVNFPIFGMPVIAFAVAVLVAIGVEGLVQGEVRRRRFLALLAVFAAGVAVLLRIGDEQLGNFSTAYLAKWFALAAVGTALTVAAFLLGGRLGRVALAAAILGELLLLAPKDFQAPRYDPYTRPQWLQYVARETAATQERVFGKDAKLFPNVASAYGISDIRSLDALYPDRYVTYVKSFIQPDFRDRYVGGAYASVERSAGHILDNPMFDLTGVRYVITGGSTPAGATIDEYFQQHPPSSSVVPAAINRGGDVRTALGLRPNARATFPIPPGATKLSFSVASDPASAPGGDLTAVVALAGGASDLWRGPTTDGWQDATIDLPGSATAVEFAAEDAARRETALLGFADIRFGVGTVPAGPQYHEVTSSDGARVFENARRAPRAFVVHDLVPVETEQEALAAFGNASVAHPGGGLKVESLDPRRTAVVEGAPEGVGPNADCGSTSAASIRRYELSEVVIEVDSPCPGLLILTDLFFPGWTARVNGRRATVHPTDIAFRGVMIGSGHSTVEFKYRPRSFALGVVASAAGGVAATAALLLPPLLRRRRTND